MADNIIYSYMKVIKKDGSVFGIIAMESGTVNEVNIVNWAVDKGYEMIKSSEDEYNSLGEDDGFKEIQIAK